VRGRKRCTCNTRRGRRSASPILHKSDGRRLLAEALAAQVETILADETRLMCAEAALARTLSKLAGTGKPDGVVSHFVKRAGFG